MGPKWPFRGGVATAWAAALVYSVLAMAMTWPLTARLSSALPSDLADPGLNAWVLAWGSQHVLRLFRGELGAFVGFWDANILHPAPLALAYSESLIAPALQVAPLYGLTGDPVLCHNVLVLSSFVLSGLGAFLLTRELVGQEHPVAAFFGGLLYAFALYRVEQLPHLQVLSAHWMPFVLLGLWRFMASGRMRPLVWGVLALLAQNLSCGYHLLYFPLFLPGFVLFAMGRLRRLRSRRIWAGLIGGALFTLTATVPLFLPYVALREQEPTRRSLLEVEQFSADVYSFLTAPEYLGFWGPRLQMVPRPEGGLFPGFVPVLLALVALTAVLGRAWREGEIPAPHGSGRGGVLVTRAVSLAVVIALGAVLLRALGVQDLGILRLPGLGSLLLGLAGAALAASLTSPPCRRGLAVVGRSWAFALLLGVLLSAWLACGPTVRSLGRETGLPSLYAVLYAHVPGFDGLRVPARFTMITTLFLSLLGGLGAGELERLARIGRPLLAVLALAFLGEAAAVPFPLNGSWGGEGVRAPTLVRVARDLPPVYGFVATLPSTVVLAELPIGLPCWETRYMLCSTRHGRRLVNGYSGYSPGSYPEGILGRADRDPDQALRTARQMGVTHVIVHEGAFFALRGRRVTRRLQRAGARELARFGSDVVLEVPRASSSATTEAPAPFQWPSSAR